MSRIILYSLTALLICLSSVAYADYEKESTSKWKQGWNWYKEPKEEKIPEEKKVETPKKPEMEVIKAPESKEPKKVAKDENDDQKYNNSVEDFRYPLTEEARRVPVLAAWLQNPNAETARKWLQWQSKYMEHTSKIGWSLRFAYLNHGDTDYRLPGYASTPIGAAISSRKEQAAYKNVFESVNDKVALFFFYKKGCDVCEANISPLKIFADRYKMKIYGVVQAPGDIEPNLPFKTFVSPQMFYQYKITSVPTFGALYAKEKKFQVIAQGYMPTDYIELNLRSFLYYAGLIDQSEFIRLWKTEDTAVLQTLLNKSPQKGQSGIQRVSTEPSNTGVLPNFVGGY